MWLPADRLLNDCGLEHAEKEPASSLHSKVLGDSVEWKVNVAEVLLLGSEGVESMIVSGAIVSTLNVLEAVVWLFPALSVASACTV